MEIETQELVNNEDIIYKKIKENLNNSSNILHKKALILIETLHSTYNKNKMKGIEGIKTYTKSIIDLCINYQKKEDFEEGDILNYETLIFVLSVCISYLPSNFLRISELLSKLESILNYTLKEEGLSSNYNALKYSNQILEQILLSRQNEELSNPSDPFVKYYSKSINLIIFNSLSNTKDDLQKDLSKSISKIIVTKQTFIRYTILQNLYEFIKSYINKIGVSIPINAKDEEMSASDSEEEIDTKGLKRSLNTKQIERLLNFLSVLIQFLPFDLINDIIFQLHTLIESISDSSILTNCFFCIDLAFSTKDFAIETIEKFLRLLLNKNASINKEITIIKNQTQKEKFLISYIKAVTQTLLNLNKMNQLQSLKYFIGILSFFSEFLHENSNFVKQSIYNSLENLFNKLFNKQSLTQLFNEKDDLTNFEMTLDLNKNNKNIDGDFILQKITKSLLFLISSRYDDTKIGYNLLLIFIEKINSCSSELKSHITPINQEIIMKLGESEHKSELLKIFIGKSTNYISLQIILQYFPLGILDYDIENVNYTEESNVWIISYIDKFLKENSVQNLEDFIIVLLNIVNELETFINKLISAPINSKDDIEMDEQEINPNYDERLEVNQKDTKHIRDVKIKRYKLILTQIMSQLFKFTNYSNNYATYVTAFLQKFKQYFLHPENCYIFDYKEICFRFMYKCINVAQKMNDQRTFDSFKNEEIGSYFFNEIFKNLLLGKLKKNETQEAFNVISKFCVILDKNNLILKISEMIERFINGYKEFKLEQNVKTNDKNEEKKIISKKEKNLNKLLMRLEIINFVFKTLNIKVSNNNPNQSDIESNFFNKILNLFDQIFFDGVQNTKNYLNSELQIKKKLFDIFLTILSKLSDEKFVLEIFKKLYDKKCMNIITSKQQSKLFEFIVDILLKQLSLNPNIEIKEINDYFFFFLDIAVLTKDVNKKVRNTAYEIIEKISEFLTKRNLHQNWMNNIMSNLTTKSTFIISAIINAVSKIYWDKRNENNIMKEIKQNSDIMFLFFDSCKNNKEILKSLFMYIRVLLYIIKNNINNPISDPLVNQIIYLSLTKIDEQGQKEFKVKIRNLIKNLIINFSYEKVKSITPEKYLNLIQYVNKHIVNKKQKENFNDEENYYLLNNKDVLDDSVMMDNEMNLLDEEEEYIKQEFKKSEKKQNDTLEDKNRKMIKKLEKWKLFDDDVDEVREKEKEELNKKNDKSHNSLDQIEQLFIKDNVELNNFFYINPFVNKNSSINEQNNREVNNKNKDVLYDKTQGKLIVKDLEKEFFEKKMKKNDFNSQMNKEALESKKLLKNKRVQNVQRDKIDFDSDDENIQTKRKKKMKLSDEKTYKKGVNEHYVKYSGNEYKNKNSKGDKILKGKFEPFAYIQLNPKTVGNKNSKDSIKVFEDLMRNNNKK